MLPRVLFLDQSGQLGGAELMLADVAVSFGLSSATLLFEDGPFRSHLEARGVRVQVIATGRRLAVSKSSGPGAWVRAIPAFGHLVAEVSRASAEFDVLYANTAKALVVGAVVAALHRKPLVFHLHDLVSPEHFSRINRWILVQSASRMASWIISNSVATRTAFLSAGGRASRHIVIYNGFDCAQFTTHATAQAERVRAEFGIGLKPLAVVAGRLTPWKGQHVLLAAAREMPDLHVLIVGGALFTEADRTYDARLRGEAEAPALRGRIHFAGHRNDIVPFYHAADVVVHCSTAAEPFGRVVVEAMLAGRPVVATDAGGVREILHDPATGVLVAPGDVTALAMALRRLFRDPAASGTMAAAGQQEARRRFGLGGILTEIEGVVRAASVGDPASR